MSPERIRVVHCISALRIGGTEGQLAELITRLPRERFEQLLVLVTGGGPLLERVRGAGCRVVELGFGFKGGLALSGRLALIKALLRYWQELRAFRPDIVHAQLFWANVLSVTAARLARVPVVITARRALDRGDEEPRWARHALNLANRFTTSILANSDAVRRDTLAHERVRPESVTVIPNGVPVELYGREHPDGVRRELNLPEESAVLVTVANLRPVKGHEDLLRAVALLRRSHPGLRLLLAGRDGGILPRLQSLARELDLGERVIPLGERRDVPRLLAAADVAVQPSHREGFPNAILEAMSAGRPVVATAVGGNPEALRDGIDGFLVPPRDPPALAAAIDRLLSSPELRRRMGESARRRVEAEFSMERMVQRVAAWYESLARAPRAVAAVAKAPD
jgi:glycosyltransferase involved in cell wall biosynthesis